MCLCGNSEISFDSRGMLELDSSYGYLYAEFGNFKLIYVVQLIIALCNQVTILSLSQENKGEGIFPVTSHSLENNDRLFERLHVP